MAELEWNGDHAARLATQAAERALARLAMTAVTIAKQRAPVDTRRLQRSIRTAPPSYDVDDTEEATSADLAATSVEDVLRQVEERAILVGSWVRYSYFVERGTSRMIAHPYIQPTMDALIGGALFADYVDEEIEKVVE